MSTTESAPSAPPREATVAVVGSRTFGNYALLKRTLDNQTEVRICAIISGGAAGADSLAERYAKERGLPLEILKPDWRGKGRAAGIMRNGDIVARADFVFAFWDGQSRGTRDTIEKARKAGKGLVVVKETP